MRMEATNITRQDNSGDYVQFTTSNEENTDNVREDIIEEEEEEEQSNNNHGDNYPHNKSETNNNNNNNNNNNEKLTIESSSSTKFSLIKMIFYLLGIQMLVPLYACVTAEPYFSKPVCGLIYDTSSVLLVGGWLLWNYLQEENFNDNERRKMKNLLYSNTYLW